jgi:hypothetical protein
MITMGLSIENSRTKVKRMITERLDKYRQRRKERNQKGKREMT